MIYLCSFCKSEFKTEEEAKSCEEKCCKDKKKDILDIIYLTNNTLDTTDKKHCLYCSKLLKDKKEIKIKHRIIFNGRYCIPCSVEMEKEILKVLSAYKNLLGGYSYLNEIIQTIISLVNSPTELKEYLKNLMLVLKKKNTIIKNNIKIT